MPNYIVSLPLKPIISIQKPNSAATIKDALLDLIQSAL